MKEMSCAACPDENVKKVVTDRVVFEKAIGELVLKKIYVEKGESEEQTVETIMGSMEWNQKWLKT